MYNLPSKLGFWSSLAGVLLCLVYLLALLGNYRTAGSLQLIEPYQALISVVLLLSCPLLVFVFAALHGAIGMLESGDGEAFVRATEGAVAALIEEFNKGAGKSTSAPAKGKK